MKYIVKFIVLIIILICVKNNCIANGNGEGESLISVGSTVDKTKITIGEKVRLEITIDYPDEVEVLLSEIKEKIEVFTVTDFGIEELKKEEGIIRQERWYILETYTIGSQFIPAIEIKHKRKSEEKIRAAKTPELFIEVVSLLDEDASDIRDIKPPVSLEKNYFRLYIIIAIVFGILAIAGGIVLFLYRRKHREKIDFAPEPLSAHEVAYDELEILKALNLISKGRIKEYYYRLSNIVRHYIEDRFKLMAPERTTEEFFAEMATSYKLEEKHKQLISNFLEHCDLVKYAKYGPDNQEIEEAFVSAEKLVDETKEDLHDKAIVRKEKALDRITG